MKSHRLTSLAVALVVTIFLATGIAGALFEPSAVGRVAQNNVTTPLEFFGHELGADRQLARWDRLVEYFELLESESDRVQVTNMGPTTEGHPFLLVTISSPENISNLDRLAEISRGLADPRGLSPSQVEAMVREGKAVVAQSLGLHSSEVAGAQTGPAIAYEMASRNDEEALRILDETVLLLLPCINPDGQIMITDWYRETVGTEYEGAGLPFLYHKYVGHDNNRDGDFLNMAESVHMAKVLYRDWKPQAYVDHHQMGSYGARFFVPPYSEPMRPGADPLQWRELSWYGAHIAYKLEEAGMAGVLNAAQYPGWGHFGWHWITPFHNITGMLTEAASATLATPLFIHPDQLSGGALGLPTYEAQSNMPNPWPGGWWRVSDIVAQQKVAAWALQDMAARNRETVLRNAYLKATRQTERGAMASPNAYIVPANQHDGLTATKMINTLLMSDVQIQEAREAFSVDGMMYGAGSYVVSMAQPKTGLILNLLGRTFYPDNEWTRARDGSPLRPYDSSTHTMAEFMGVRVDPVDVPEGVVPGSFATLAAPVAMTGSVASGGSDFRLDGRQNAAFTAVNKLLDAGIDVRRADRADDTAGLRPGDFIVGAGAAAALRDVARSTGVDFESLAASPADATTLHDVTRMRVGMYQRYRGGNMDEGWTRFTLEQFGFPYTSLMDAEIKAGNLKASYDVIIFPQDSTDMITGESPPGPPRPFGAPRDQSGTPPEYRSGIGEEGVEAIKAFVDEGGTLVALGGATAFAIEKLGLNVRNVLQDVASRDFFAPGSTLRVSFDNTHPLGYGMPDEGVVLFWSGPAFAITPSMDNDDYATVVRYADRDIMQSGWLVGEQHIAKRAGMVVAQHGDGQAVLIGFRTQHRSQTHGTFKLLFNTMLR